MQDLVLISAPAVEPVSLAEARLHLRLADDDTAEDALVGALIQQAREAAEHQTGRRLITQTWEMALDAFPGGCESIQLHSGLAAPQAVVSIQYVDTVGTLQTVDPATYALDARTLPGYVFPAATASWPTDVSSTANAVRVRVRCGYGDAGSAVPAGIRAWCLLQVGLLYKAREAAGAKLEALPDNYVDRLLDPFRVYL